MVNRNEIHRSYPILSYQCYPQVLAIIVPKTWVPKLYLKDVNNLLYAQTNNISQFPFVPDNLVSRDRFSRSVRRQPAHSPYSGWIWCLLAEFLPNSAAASIYLFIPPYAIGPLPSLSCKAIAYRWCSLPRVPLYRAISPQGNSSNWCCLCSHHGPTNNVHLSFPTPAIIIGIEEWAC